MGGVEIELHALLNSALDGGEWPALHPCRLTAGIRFPAGAENFSPHHRVQTGSGIHPRYYLVSTRGSFPVGKVAGV